MLVLDANILMRAVLGKRVRSLLAKYAGRIEFVAPVAAFDEAGKHPPPVIRRKNLTEGPFMAYFESLANTVPSVDPETYRRFESVARQRLAGRDEDDWPVLATALALNCAIWTEDTDFFGCGVAIWTTDRVELHLSQSGPTDVAGKGPLAAPFVSPIAASARPQTVHEDEMIAGPG